MSSVQKGVPEGYHAMTPYLIVRDANQAVRFYQQAFDATELRRSVDLQGVVQNVQLRIGDSPFMLGIRPNDQNVIEQRVEDIPRVSIYLFCDDADRVFDQAISHGATILYRPENQDYGNREGGLLDPFGVTWWVATQIVAG
jgi:PhnB protein